MSYAKPPIGKIKHTDDSLYVTRLTDRYTKITLEITPSRHKIVTLNRLLGEERKAVELEFFHRERSNGQNFLCPGKSLVISRLEYKS